MANGTIIVTGAAGGLGQAFVKEYLDKPYSISRHSIFTVRKINGSTTKELEERVAGATSKTTQIVELDLSSLTNVRAFAQDVNSKVSSGQLPPIRALVLNAAVQSLRGLQYTSDGFETTFAVNYLANFQLALLLLESMDKEMGRIVFISSTGHDPFDSQNHLFWPSKEARIEAVRDPMAWAKPGPDKEGDEWAAGLRRYGLSKLWLLMFQYELQRRLDGKAALQNISSLSLDPGGMTTAGLFRDWSPVRKFLLLGIVTVLVRVMMYFSPNGVFRTTEKSANDLLNACFDETKFGKHPQGVNINGSEVKLTSLDSRDEAKQRKLWQGTLRLLKMDEAETALLT
ncbi:MAG: hypothetical protein MMC33_006234 [Icmadophila ericetorum]|nr:hypothetical protein [Icmadophila ericetorum]